ncbi:MAG: adenosylcobalamin-dependent ribonucleoside-diphosphate reductase, partial [Candidatus Aenigmarchaeota archaeon]|nr:adenosylcobalamin-dependent ribonucleoside-diphosphate reductase [Candidatus Aenigmarchaeota archaeon]
MADELPSYIEDVPVSENAYATLVKRYLKKDGKKIESVAELFYRVASNISQADLNYEKTDLDETTKEFYELMAKKKFMPNSPTLMNAGRDLQQLSGCFVLPINDSMESIGNTYRDAMLVHKSGGGTGFSFSKLRPQGDSVKSTSGTASGPISFMTVFNTVTEVVKQGGTRRGANMAILRADHPNIEQFITCKDTDKTLTNFNISVALTEEVMNAAKEDKEYDLVNPKNSQPVRKVKARDILNKIAECAWRNGEPGIVFMDRINEYNPTHPKYYTGGGELPLGVGVVESTNPCGEQPLLPYESCNLGSINLSLFVNDNGEINYQELGKTVDSAVHFLDNVIDMNKYPVELIGKTTKRNRKIGLGVMGFADALIKMGIPYDSEKGVEIGENMMKFIQERSKDASHELAEKRGVFPNFPHSVYAKGRKMRHAATTTIAPTGSIGMIADCSGGIEPIFGHSATKTVMDKDELYYFTESLQKALEKEGITKDKAIMKKIVDTGRPRIVDGVPEYIRKVFATAHDVTPEWHVKMQAAFQRYTDNAVSKTINLPNSATIEDIRNAFALAYKLGCKGLTVYRDGSRSFQVYDSGKKEKTIKPFKNHPQIKRKESFYGAIETGEGTLQIGRAS